MNCLDCGMEDKRKSARGLCGRCYDRHRNDGTIIDYERLYRPRSELLAEWDALRSQGFSRAYAAERLGITRNALDKAISRASRKAA